MESSDFVLKLLAPHSHLEAFVRNQVRTDGREFNERRPVEIATASTACAEASCSSVLFMSAPPRSGNTCGSSCVSMGGTKMVCSISLQIGVPSIGKPEDGDVTFDVALGPMVSAKFDQLNSKAGRKHDEAIDLETLLYALYTDEVVSGISRGGGGRALSPQEKARAETNTARVLDLKQLCISPGRYAFRLNVHLVCVSLNGNLNDCAIRAVTAALQDVRLPACDVRLGEAPPVALDYTETRCRALCFNTVPQPVTVGILTLSEGSKANSKAENGTNTSVGVSGNVFLVDPSAQEEELVRTVTVVVGSQQELLVVQHNESSPTSARGGGMLSQAATMELVGLCQQVAVAAQ